MKKVVYHGGEFGKEYFWFSSDKDVAASYGNIRMIDRGYSGISDTILDDFRAYEINIQNPYIIDAKEEYYMDIPTPQEMLDDDFWHSETVDTDGICEYAKKKGHDSVIIKNVVEGHGIYNIADDYVCFNKSQFKELYNNMEKVDELKKELHNLIKTYGKNLKDDNQFIEDDIFELYLKNPVKLKYKEISKFTAYNDYFMLGKENYMYEPDVIDKYEDLEMIINAVKKEVKQPTMVESIKRINERLEDIGKCFITKSAYDIVNLLKNKPKEYRILYDNRIKMYMIGDANDITHWDMIQDAYKNALYYDQEDFIEKLGGTLDNYVDIGQSGFWDGDTEEENIEPYLWYIVFSPNEEWILGTDGYNKRYDYPFGHVFTRGCDLDEIDLWDALGIPQETERLNESNNIYEDAATLENTTQTKNFRNWFRDSKIINSDGTPHICYHYSPNVFNSFDANIRGDNGYFGNGIYFTGRKDFGTGFGKNKYECYIRITNPLNFEIFEENTTEAYYFLEYLKQYEIEDYPIDLEDEMDSSWSDNIITPYKLTFQKIHHGLLEPYGEYIRKYAEDMGYDGIISDSGFTEIVVFESNQVKSINNNGQWSNSANIYESLNKELEQYL